MLSAVMLNVVAPEFNQGSLCKAHRALCSTASSFLTSLVTTDTKKHDTSRNDLICIPSTFVAMKQNGLT
jgi:hypothetical protein